MIESRFKNGGTGTTFTIITMSASSSADDILAQIPSESLQQLLVSVVHKIKPPPLTTIASLDSYLATVANPDTAPLISVHGPSSSGKTHLLYYLAATCVMPTSHSARALGGWSKAAFIFDLDGHFQLTRFRQVLIDRIQRALPALDVTKIVERCLTNTHIFQPLSSDHLAATLMHLPRYHEKHCPDIDLGMVCIHSINAFTWIDRFTAEQLGSSSTTKTPMQNVLYSLERLRSRYDMCVVLTDWGLPQQQQVPSVFNNVPCPSNTFASTLAQAPDEFNPTQSTFTIPVPHQVILTALPTMTYTIPRQDI
ncbi:hypothetical protein CPC08DRAFT_5056 [Agrocybe pediades]|nr:hypothetical protein CPC08DRAFT_5056 [Agrocybe pediades]